MKGIIFASIIVLPTITLAQTSVPNNWRCTQKVGGSYQFGRAPDACNSSDFGSDQTVYQDYPTLFYDETNAASRELPRYLTQMNALLRDVATRYYKSRVPSASAREIQAWIHAIQATAQQESYWSHYRLSSTSKLKFVRGDSGHGHGFFQIDDRWHFTQVNQGVAWNLVQNILLGLEEFYSNWSRALKASCYVNHPTDRNRARAAYSAYNGGPSSICRWQDSSSPWAYIDQSYAQFYDDEQWLKSVTDANATADVDLNCLMNNQLVCPAPLRDLTLPAQPLSGVVYHSEKSGYCTWTGTRLECVTNAVDIPCLRIVNQIANAEAILQLPTELDEELPSFTFDRHELCAQADPSLLKVGDLMRLNHPVLIYANAGYVVGNLPAGTEFQIIDFRLLDSHQRQYHIHSNNLDATIQIVNEQDQSTLLSRINQGPRIVAVADDKIKIEISDGIHLRSLTDKQILATLARGTTVTVLASETRGDDNEIYYKVRSGGVEGYLFSGHLLPNSTISQWTTLVK